MRCRNWGLLLTIVVFILTAAGCTQQEIPAGVVAMVGDKPIALRTLQTMQDTRTAGLGAFEKPSLSILRKQYGEALTTLIAQEVVLQELEELGMPVSDEAVSEAEARIRQDYPDEEFEKNLAESAIDLQAWRELMRYRIAMFHFTSQVLKPKVVVPLEEIESFYKQRHKEFVTPRTLTLYQVAGENKAKVEAMREEIDIPEDAFGEARGVRLHLRRESVPPEWEKLVRPLKPGECTKVVERDGKFQFVCLIGENPAKDMTIAEAYPYIEEILLEDKLDEAFHAWLEKKLSTVRIRISTHLVEEMREEKAQ